MGVGHARFRYRRVYNHVNEAPLVVALDRHNESGVQSPSRSTSVPHSRRELQPGRRIVTRPKSALLRTISMEPDGHSCTQMPRPCQ